MLELRATYQAIDFGGLVVDRVSPKGLRVLFNVPLEAYFKTLTQVIDWLVLIINVATEP